MKIREVLYKTPEMTEEKLLEIMDNNISLFLRDKILVKRIRELHNDKRFISAILEEYDLIQDKKSYLTKSQREQVVGFVGLCIIQMTKGKEINE